MEKNPCIYVGGISTKASEQDLIKKFEKFGKIYSVNLKFGYAFIVSKIFFIFIYWTILKEYDDYHSARECVKKMHGRRAFSDQRLIVESTRKNFSKKLQG